jgi:glucuronate isomerase
MCVKTTESQIQFHQMNKTIKQRPKNRLFVIELYRQGNAFESGRPNYIRNIAKLNEICGHSKPGTNFPTG